MRVVCVHRMRESVLIIYSRIVEKMHESEERAREQR